MDLSNLRELRFRDDSSTSRALGVFPGPSPWNQPGWAVPVGVGDHVPAAPQTWWSAVLCCWMLLVSVSVGKLLSTHRTSKKKNAWWRISRWCCCCTSSVSALLSASISCSFETPPALQFVMSPSSNHSIQASVIAMSLVTMPRIHLLDDLPFVPHLLVS